MIELRRRQMSFAEGLIAEEVDPLWDEWMRQVDEVLEDEKLLEIVHGALARRHPRSRSHGRPGTPAAVTLIQRFGSALNLNIHLHMLVLDGAFLAGTSPPVFRRIAAPTERELQALVERIAERIGRALERDGLITRDCENTYLNFAPTEGAPLNDLIGHSITYRVAVGPRTGQKVFTLRSLAAQRDDDGRKGVAEYAGFSLHAGVGIEADARGKLERVCRYISRPAIAEERLSLTPQGDVHVRLKTPYRDGTTHVVLEPLDFMARLAALVPPPRAHQTRYHGVLAPGSALRSAVTPSGRGQGASKHSKAQAEEGGAPKALRMTWMQRLKRVFSIEIETCQRCGGKLEVIASIEDAELIGRILEHRAQHGEDDLRGTPFAPRAPPQPPLL